MRSTRNDEYFSWSFLFVFVIPFVCLLRVSSVCKKWKLGVKQSLARRKNLSFAGWKMDDDSTARLVGYAYSLKELEMYSFLSLLILCYCFFPSCSGRKDWRMMKLMFWIKDIGEISNGNCMTWNNLMEILCYNLEKYILKMLKMGTKAILINLVSLILDFGGCIHQ